MHTRFRETKDPEGRKRVLQDIQRKFIENVARQTLDTFGRVDVLVNNARYIGPGHMDPFLETPIKYLELHDRCNVLGPLYLTQLLVPRMIEQGGGIVFTIDSGAGWQETAAPVRRRA